MSAFYDNNVTDVGRLLLGDVQMGASFVPTKIVIGKGYLPQGKTTRTMTDVADVVKELALNKATKILTVTLFSVPSSAMRIYRKPFITGNWGCMPRVCIITSQEAWSGKRQKSCILTGTPEKMRN